MLRCDFNKFDLKLYWNRTSAWILFCKFAAYFQNAFRKIIYDGLLLALLLSTACFPILMLLTDSVVQYNPYENNIAILKEIDPV